MSNELLDAEIVRLTRKGWQIVSRQETAVQMKKPRRFSVAGLVLFIALPALVGILIWSTALWVALGGLVLVLLDYLLRRERLEYITTEDLETGKQIKA